MKPRITRRWGIWMCKRQNEHAPRGYGYTPLSAYLDWLAEHPVRSRLGYLSARQLGEFL